VARVTSRQARPILVFPAEEAWTLAEHHAEPRLMTRSFVAGQPAGEPGVDFATITLMRGIWEADFDRVQRLFGQKLGAECAEPQASQWFDTMDPIPRRLIVWTCPSADPPFAILQLLIQGPDDLFSVELYSRSGLPAEGLLVRWAEWLKEIALCDRGAGGAPCPPGNWDE
jgi:hypothetical protein